MDGELLRSDPASVCRNFCDAVDIPFQPDALSWKKGDEQHWNRWQDWFSEASSSTQFLAPEEGFDEELLQLPALKAAMEYAVPSYEYLSNLIAQRVEGRTDH